MFGSKLSEVRRKRGLSQTELAKKIDLSGVDQKKISLWENEKARPKEDQALVLAKVLDCDILLTYYSYSSPVNKHLMKTYFPGAEFGSHRDLKNLVKICSTVMDMVKLYSEILGGWKGIKDKRYYSDIKKLIEMTSRLSVMSKVLDDIAHDFMIKDNE